MASSIASVSLVPLSAYDARSLAVRPVEAGVPTGPRQGLDAEALRRDQAAQGEALREAPNDRPEARTDDTSDANQAEQQPTGRREPPGNNAPFLAQLLSQDQRPPRQPNPFADAARAYGRFREEPRNGFVLDLPQRVDVKV